MKNTESEIEQVSPAMLYWIGIIVLTVVAVYFILGIQVDATSAADFSADPTTFTFVCPLGTYH
jgi:Na+/H+ antiporter NhaC